MNNTEILSKYNIHVQTAYFYQGRQAFYSNGTMFVLCPVTELSEEEVLELKYFGDYLYFQGEDSIAVVIPNANQEIITEVNNERYIVFMKKLTAKRYHFRQGSQLAHFHQRGRYYSYTYPITTRSRYGNWEVYWKTRLEQLESWCQERLRANPNSLMEKTFIETFPYYLGLTENSIQFIVDSKRDNTYNLDQVDQPTICYIKYPFQQLNGDTLVFPDQLVFDHPTRDIAEWIRQCFVNGDEARIVEFLNDYEQLQPLSVYSWKLLYGRLLFPLRYFEIMENYYRAKTDQERINLEQKFMDYLERAAGYERFLRDFFVNIGLSAKKFQIYEPEWIKKVK